LGELTGGAPDKEAGAPTELESEKKNEEICTDVLLPQR
jgi:hypothetical protein